MPSNPANGPRQMQTRWPTREKAHGLAGSCAAMIILIQAISASEMGRGFTRTRNREDTWNLDNGPPILIIEAAEHESRKQAAPPGIDWHILFQPAAAERPGHRLLTPGLHGQGKPLEPSGQPTG